MCFDPSHPSGTSTEVGSGITGRKKGGYPAAACPARLPGETVKASFINKLQTTMGLARRTCVENLGELCYKGKNNLRINGGK